MISPRSPIPPPIVLEKLCETNASRSHRLTQSQAPRSSSVPRPHRQKALFRPFSLTSSMEKNLQDLHRIGKELEDVNRDLSKVIDMEKHPSASEENYSFSDTSSLDESSSRSSSPEVTGYSLYSAVRDFEMADLAHRELLIVLADIKLSYQIEAKDLIARASCLQRESETFKKMSTEALTNLSNTSSLKY